MRLILSESTFSEQKQEQARRDTINRMGEKDVLVTLNWVMKFLPRKYREGTVDWFA